MLRFCSFLVLCSAIILFTVSTAYAAPKKKSLVAQQLALEEAVLAAIDTRPLPPGATAGGVLVDPYEFNGETYYWCRVGDTYYNCRFYDCSTCGSAAQ